MAKKKSSLGNKKNKIENREDNKKTKNNRELYWVLGAMTGLVGVFFISYFIFQGLNTFEYNGLTFTRERFGDIPVFRHYYFFNSGGELFKYNLYLRNDPRKNNVPITGKAIDEGIEFRQDNSVYISIGKEGLIGCEYGSVGISQLASFLTDNQLNVRGASTDEELAEENNVEYATCDTHPDDFVIILEEGEKTEIIGETDNCYLIKIANCEVLEAIEKFQVESVLDARQRKVS